MSKYADDFAFTRRSLIAAGVALATLGPGQRAHALANFTESPLTIVSGARHHEFTVELAVSEAQRAQGLMFRSRLAPDRGMLFIYEPDRIINMWMKNTLIPLDMLFVDGTGKIVNIHERAVPGSLRTISSGRPVRGVIELPGGTVDRLDIQVGDRIIHESF